MWLFKIYFLLKGLIFYPLKKCSSSEGSAPLEVVK